MNVEISDIQVSSLSEGGQSGGEFVLIAGPFSFLFPFDGRCVLCNPKVCGDSEYYDEEYEEYED